jgi:hypothetical protein
MEHRRYWRAPTAKESSGLLMQAGTGNVLSGAKERPVIHSEQLRRRGQDASPQERISWRCGASHASSRL